MCACSGKKTIEATITETPEVSIILEKRPEILYVNSKEGLRVRDKPGLTGNRIFLLSHKEPVTLIEKSETPVEIDNIIGFWCLITNNEITGWVFGGFLCNSLDEIVKNELQGTYSYYSVDMKKGMLNELDGIIDEYICEIEHMDNDNFLFKTNIPFFFGNRGENKNVQFKYPPEEVNWSPNFLAGEEGTPFYYAMGEKGGGGTYIYLYYNQEQIIINYLKFRDMNGYLEDWEPREPVYWLEFQMILKKKK
jgi:hypothetical protein